MISKSLSYAAVLLAFSMPLQAATQTMNGLEWHYTLRGETSASVKNSRKKTAAIPATTRGMVRVPKKFGKANVTSLGACAFYKCTGLTEAILPKSLKTIYGEAFRGCTSLRRIKLPDEMTFISKECFRE